MEELTLFLEGEEELLRAVNKMNQYSVACSAKDSLDKQDLEDALLNHPDASVLLLMSHKNKDE